MAKKKEDKKSPSFAPPNRGASEGKKIPKEPKKTKVVASNKEPQTMEELLSSTGYQLKGLKKGSFVDGTIKEITRKTLYLDVGGKTEGIVSGKEFELVRGFINQLKIGDKVKAYVGSPESEGGQILLSLRDFAKNSAWKEFEDLLSSQEEVDVIGREINKGGLIVDAPYGLQGFIPGSQIGSFWRGKLEQLVGKNLKAKVIEIKREQNRLVFSEKAVSDAKKIANLAKILQKIKNGDIFEAEVTQIVPFGIFVKIMVDKEPAEGLIHISEISWLKVDDLSKLYKLGDKLKAKVISLEDNRLQFSLKQLLPDPWDDLEVRYPLEKGLAGKVIKLASFGALVEIEPGVEGLLHISKIPPEFSINEGDKVDVFIDSIDKKTRRISLGLVLKEKPLEYK